MTPDQRRRRRGTPDNQGTPFTISPLTPTVDALADAATGKLTQITAAPLDGETVVIDGKTYTYRTVLGTAATGILTLTGTTKPTDGDTVTIDGKVYTFQDTLTDVDGNVATDVDADGSIDNLVEAINLGVGAGTKYAASMTIHPTVSAANGIGDTMDVTAKADAAGAGTGAAGNSIATTETIGTGSWGGATLSGGVDSVVNGEVLATGAIPSSLTNLRAAINLEGPILGRYSIPTTLHPTVSAASAATDELDVTAKTPGAAGNSITTTETLTTGSWGGATLSGGLDAGAATQQMTATRTLFDEDVSVRGGLPAWDSDTPAVATISQPNDADGDGVSEDAGGLLTGVSAGVSEVDAVFPGADAPSTTATVT